MKEWIKSVFQSFLGSLLFAFTIAIFMLIVWSMKYGFKDVVKEVFQLESVNKVSEIEKDTIKVENNG